MLQKDQEFSLSLEEQEKRFIYRPDEKRTIIGLKKPGESL